MKRFLFLLTALIVTIVSVTAQELRYKTFECRTFDMKAKVEPRYDNNNEPCALIRVCVALENPTIDGNMGNVGKMQSPKPSQYEVYVPAGTRRILICHPDYLPFHYDFSEKIEGLKTYELYITVPEAGPTKPEIKQQWVKLTVSTPGATVLIDGMPQTVKDGVVYASFALGTHSYYITAPQHYPQESDFTLVASKECTNLPPIELKPSHLPLDLRVSPANATVLIDGKMLSLSGGNLTQKFEIGKHSYQISAPQHYTQSGEFEITAAGPNSLAINLQPSHLALNMHVAPADATVLIDGTQHQLSAGNLTQKFEIGKHSYQISAPQHYTQSGEFEITAAGPNSLAINLQPSHLALNLHVTPADATVLINGTQYQLSAGSLTQKFEIGKHNYQILASQYHSKSGEFEITSAGATNLNIELKPAFGHLQVGSSTVGAEVHVNGEKRGIAPCNLQLTSGQYVVQLVKDGYISYQQSVTISDGVTVPFNNTLKANFAQVTLKAPFENSEIWVNDQFKAKGSWSGRLNANSYLVETRTEGYENASENIEVVAEVPRTYTLQTPRPIYGMVEIISDPFEATIKLDGKVVGTTPWQSNEVLTGKHTLEIIKEDYNLYTQEFTLTKEQPVSIEAVLDNRPTLKMEEFFPIFKNITLGKTTVMDLRDKGYPVKTKDNGDNYCEVYRWEVSDKDGDDIFESASATHYGGMPADWSLRGFDWSNSYDTWIEYFESWGFNIEKEPIDTNEYDGRTCLDTEFTATSKDGSISFRLDFNYGNDKGEGYTTSSKNSLYGIYVDVYPIGNPNYISNIKKKYKVGDYYNENGKKGVVFWVDETGEHGKIISMTESRLTPLKWFSGYYKYYKKELKEPIGADSRTDGAKNMEAVKNRKDWQSKYPAFKWCANLGEGWYLPAIDELKIFTLNKWVYDTVNQTLAQHGGRELVKSIYDYWSSTEKNEPEEGYYKNVWVVRLSKYQHGTFYNEKTDYSGGIVRAVAAF